MALDLTPEYAKSLGRIGGQLLSANLELQGNDLQFDTDLLYLDVANKRIGINNYGASPFTLYLGTAASDQKLKTNNLIVDGLTTTNNGWTIQANNIQQPASGTLYLRPVQTTNPVIYTNGVGDDKINITDLLISAKTINENINLTPNGTGIVNVTGNMEVHGTSGLTYVTGNVLVDGNYLAGSQINFGDQAADTVDFNAELNHDLIPSTNNTYDLGSVEKWGFTYNYNYTATNTTATIGTFGGISIRGSNIYSSDNSKDIRIVTTSDGQSQLSVDGGYSSDVAVDLFDGGFSLDPNLSSLDGGISSNVYTTGDIVFNGLVPFKQNNINNNTFNVYNPPYYLNSTADGYIRFGGSSGLVVPLGGTNQRETEILGTLRYNIDLGYLEIYNGTMWQNTIGVVALATQQDIEDDSVIYDLMLG